GLLLEVRREAAALNHESGDDAVELRAVIVLRLYIVEEVGDGLGCRLRVQLDDEIARGGVELDLRVCRERRHCGREAEHRQRGDGNEVGTMQHRKAPWF